MPTLDGKDVKITVTAACTACGLCAKVCPCEYLEVAEGRACEKKDPPMGCVLCVQCSVICPAGAIRVEAEGTSPGDVFSFSDAKNPSFAELFRLMAGRRSIRQFKEAGVSAEDENRILEAAQQAPVGLPPSTIKVVSLNGRDKVRAFAFDFLDEAAKMSWLFSPWGIWVLRPFMPAAEHREMRDKVAPLYRSLLAGRAEQKDYLFYDAPLAMVFTCDGDPIDATIAATYAMVAAEALGLGSCMIGTVVPMLPRVSSAFCKKYGMAPGTKHGLAIVFGYPQRKPARAVRRRFAKVIQP